MLTATHSPILPLTYSVAGCSEHSGHYVAKNILVDNPMDQGSRWSGAYQASNIKQWMLLKLDQLSILRTLTFGKFHRAHPCNMKEFKLFVGETEESMTEVLHAGLRNDHVAETFSIRHRNSAGVPFPTRFVKIVPLSAHGQSFHTSIWHVRMTGLTDEKTVQQARIKHEEYKDSMILRHILKHLRQRRLLGSYQSILSHTGFGHPSTVQKFEHTTVSSLHTALVLGGKFQDAEELLASCAAEGLFSSSILSFQPFTAWSRIKIVPDSDTDNVTTRPSARGGHAMCLDKANDLIYLFGGWDGKKSLQDFWVWSISDTKWGYLGSNGPAPRACHKMVFDEKSGDIYLFGRLDENGSSEYTPSPTSTTRSGNRTAFSEPPPSRRGSSAGPSNVPEDTRQSSPTKPSAFCAEFYCYHTRGPNAGIWDLVSSDTLLDGGPPLVFDHQMVIHNKSQMIYVSGGRIVDGDWDSVKYSGVYSYNVRTSTWKLLQPIDLLNVHPSIPPRFGHSMVLDTFSDTLFIFGGQRDEKYLADMYAYHIPTDSVTEIYPNFAASGGPNACFTQRAVVDPDLKEIYVFCGLTKGPPGASSILETDAPYWVYRYERPERPGVWTKLIPSTVPELSDTAQTDDAPIPRYAHQVVYDPRSKVIYMHGGNAGMEKEVVVPMSDFAPAEGQREGQRQDSDSERTAVSETRYRVLRGHSTMESPAADYGHEAEMSEDNEGTGDRLDDFWTMRLQRPSTAEIVRRGKYLIRQQRFREMCEDTPPVTALAYLQTEVSSVVDHSDSEEARVFRSLLSHLLTPAPKLMPGLTPLEHSNSATQKRKRSPEEVMIVDEDEVMEEEPEDATDRDNGMDAEPIHPVVSFQRDATEELSDVDHPYPSPERYKQRTEVFEQLMKFINEDARQPEQNLWDMIDVDYLGAKQ